jgi:hypothetical protein
MAATKKIKNSNSNLKKLKKKMRKNAERSAAYKAI